MSNIILELERQMKQSEVVTFKSLVGDVNFSITTRFLNEHIDAAIKEFLVLNEYATNNQLNEFMPSITTGVIIKYFVKLLNNKEEAPVIQNEKGVKESFDSIINTLSALNNIEDGNGLSAYQFLIKELDKNKDGFDRMKNKISDLEKVILENRDKISEITNGVAK